MIMVEDSGKDDGPGEVVDPATKAILDRLDELLKAGKLEALSGAENERRFTDLIDKLERLKPSLRPASPPKPIPCRRSAQRSVNAMEDGTIYAGISPDTNKRMFAAPKDTPGTYRFSEAAQYAKNLDAHGHNDFYVPTAGELNVLWQNRNKGKLAGTFNQTGSGTAGWYWSSSRNNGDIGAWAQRFSDGRQSFNFTLCNSSLRCVRC
jgi:hypothetical protein